MSKKMKERMKDETGAVAVIVALTLTVLLMFVAFALDFGRVYIENSKIQTACDAAALAGATKLAEGDSAVEAEARKYLRDNGIDPSDAEIKIEAKPDGTKTVKVTKKEDVKTNFAGVMGHNKMSTEKSATAGNVVMPPTGGSGDYAIFSGSPTNTLGFTNGSIETTGSIHTNSGANVSTKVTIKNDSDGNPSGIFESYGDIWFSGNGNNSECTFAQNDASNPNRVSNIDIRNDLPYEEIIKRDYFPDDRVYTTKDFNSPEYSATNITINDDIYFNNDYIGIMNQTVIINGNVKVKGMIAVGSGGKLIINGNLEVVGNAGMNGWGTGTIEVYGGLKLTNGELNFTNVNNAKLGKSGNPNTYAIIWADKQGVDINGAAQDHYALFYVPEGEVKWNGNGHTLKGSIIADRIGSNVGTSLKVDLPKGDPAWPFNQGESPDGTGRPGGSGGSGKVTLIE